MENRFIRADDVAQELNVSKPYAYKLIRKLNEELKAKGFITIAGRVNRQYFYERLYGAGNPQGIPLCPAKQDGKKERRVNNASIQK